MSAASYFVERVGGRLGRSEAWIVRDRRTGSPVAEPVGSESAAREWIRSQVQLASSRTGPAVGAVE